MAIRAVMIYEVNQIDANDDDLWQIRGSKLLETPSCPIIPRLDIGSSTAFKEMSRGFR